MPKARTWHAASVWHGKPEAARLAGRIAPLPGKARDVWIATISELSRLQAGRSGHGETARGRGRAWSDHPNRIEHGRRTDAASARPSAERRWRAIANPRAKLSEAEDCVAELVSCSQRGFVGEIGKEQPSVF